MSKRDRILLIEDMYDAALKIKRYTEGMDYDLFLKDEKTIEDYKLMNPQLAWNHLRGFRNRIVHEYFGIDYETPMIAGKHKHHENSKHEVPYDN